MIWKIVHTSEKILAMPLSSYFADLLKFSTTLGLAVSSRKLSKLSLFREFFLPKSVKQTQTLVSTKMPAIRIYYLTSLSYIVLALTSVVNNLPNIILIVHDFPQSTIDLFTDTAAILNLLDLRNIMGCPGSTRSVSLFGQKENLTVYSSGKRSS